MSLAFRLAAAFVAVVAAVALVFGAVGILAAGSGVNNQVDRFLADRARELMDGSRGQPTVSEITAVVNEAVAATDDQDGNPADDQDDDEGHADRGQRAGAVHPRVRDGRWAGIDRSGPAPASRPHHHEHFETSEWQPSAKMSADTLEAQFQSEVDGDGLLRAKGFVETSDGVRLVQVVGRRIEVTEPEEPPDPRLLNRVVLIRRSP